MTTRPLQEAAARLQTQLGQTNLAGGHALLLIEQALAAAEERGAGRAAVDHPLMMRFVARLDDWLQQLPDGLFKESLRRDLDLFRRLRRGETVIITPETTP